MFSGTLYVSLLINFREVSAENTKYKYEYMAKVVRHLYEYLKFRLTKEQEEILERRLQSVSDFLKSLDEVIMVHTPRL